MDWGYVAGLFDGEGNLHRIKANTSVQIRIDNTCEEALVKVQQFLGYGQISNRGREKPHHKDRYRLTISDHYRIAHMLEGMAPHLIVKREAAIEMLKYIRGREWRSRKRA